MWHARRLLSLPTQGQLRLREALGFEQVDRIPAAVGEQAAYLY
ncbi:MAG: hypothetical protein ACR2K6_00245 [Solirubrobacterales bacterium]